jgi:PhnB protein
MSNPSWKPKEIKQSCIPYVLLPQGEARNFIQFLKDAFAAQEILVAPREDGSVMHAEILIDDSSFMLADATAGMTVYPFRHYIYVPDVDAVYARALECGAQSETVPADQPYGDRIGGVTDKWGNLWWLGTHTAN